MKPKTTIKILKDLENGRKQIQKAMEKKVDPGTLMQMRWDYLFKTIDNIHYGVNLSPNREDNRRVITNWTSQQDENAIEYIKEFAGTILTLYPEFLISPASAKYHGAYAGGLFDHSMAVLEAGVKLCPAFDMTIIDIDPIPFIFHDLCKVGLYKLVTKTKKDKDGKTVDASYYEYTNDMLQIQHGPESLRRILNARDCAKANKPKYTMSNEFQLAVAWHMGSFDVGTDDRIKFGNMCGLAPEVLLMHTADMIASKIMGL